MNFQLVFGIHDVAPKYLYSKDRLAGNFVHFEL